jgi:putative ABC transport system permease protein
MVSFQVALSIVLLTTAGLFIRSTLQMAKADLGFNSERVAMVSTSPAQAGYQPAEWRRVYADLEARLAAVPGIDQVVMTSRAPLSRGGTNTLVVEGYVSPTGTNTGEVAGVVVSPNYFESLGIRVLHGRTLTARDDRSAPAVAVINEAMARRFWGSTDVVGRRYRHDGEPDSWVEIVGVVANVKLTSVTEEPQPQVYRSVDQQAWPFASFLVRTAGDPANVVGTMAAAVRGLD